MSFSDHAGVKRLRAVHYSLDLRISFFCQEKGRGGIKRAKQVQVGVSEVRKGGGSETEKKL